MPEKQTLAKNSAIQPWNSCHLFRGMRST